MRGNSAPFARSPHIVLRSWLWPRSDLKCHSTALSGSERSAQWMPETTVSSSYPSSHLEGAESEFIVRFGHEAFLHPDAVGEIKRILHAHLKTV